jgi:hypothetical protein
MKIPEEIWHIRHVARYTSLVLGISPYFGADRGASIGQEWSAAVGAGRDASGTGKTATAERPVVNGEAAVGRGVDFDAAVVGAGPASRDQRYGGNGCDNFALRILSFRSRA